MLLEEHVNGLEGISFSKRLYNIATLIIPALLVIDMIKYGNGDFKYLFVNLVFCLFNDYTLLLFSTNQLTLFC